MDQSVKWTKGVKQAPTGKKINPTNVEDALKQVAPFVHTLAKKYTRNHYQYYEDFVAAGYEGALVAWNKFSGTKWEKQGYKYSSYAYWWIRERCQVTAKDLWGFQNATVSLSGTQDADEFVDLHSESYELSTDLIDLKKVFNALTVEDQKLVQLRCEGETFDVIAEQLGFDSLHAARNRYLKVVEAF